MSSIISQKVNDLRSKPEHHRQAWAVGLSVGLTSIIAIVWALNLNVSSSSVIAEQNKPSPFSQMASVVSVNAGAVKNGAVVVFSDLFSLIGD